MAQQAILLPMGGILAPKVLLDSAGAGTWGAPANSISWNHVISSLASMAACFVCSKATVSSVTIGATAMTQKASITISAGTPLYLSAYTLLSPPTGSQTVTATLSSGQVVVGNSVSVLNGKTIGTALTNNSSSGTAMTVSATSTTLKQIVLQAFAYDNGGNATDFSNYNGTQLYDLGGIFNTNGDLLMGWSYGGPTLTCSATAGSAPWGAIAIPVGT